MDVELNQAPPALAPYGRVRHGRRRVGALSSYMVLIFALITLNFLLPRALPGDPIDSLIAQGPAGFTLGEQSRVALQEYYGLDGPLVSQYGNYLSRLARGDLGRSIVTNAPVKDTILQRLPWTLLLIFSSMVIATALGMLAGIHAGWRRDKPIDRRLMMTLLAIRELPPSLLGSMLLFVFAVKLDWLPLSGGETAFSNTWSPFERAVDIGRHLILPALVLTTGLLAGSYLIMRAGMVKELGSDYLQLGRAKGLRERRLKYRYAARNALLPIVSLTAVELGFAFAVNVVVERVFAYPGIGGLLVSSIGARDYPMIQGSFLVVSLSIVTFNAVADALYRRLDPRVTA